MGNGIMDQIQKSTAFEYKSLTEKKLMEFLTDLQHGTEKKYAWPIWTDPKKKYDIDDVIKYIKIKYE
jgi:hypothetical protein